MQLFCKYARASAGLQARRLWRGARDAQQWARVTEQMRITVVEKYTLHIDTCTCLSATYYILTYIVLMQSITLLYASFNLKRTNKKKT